MVNPKMKFFVTGSTTLSDSMGGGLTGEFQHFDQQTSGHTVAWTGTPVGAFSVDLSLDGTNVDHTLTAADITGMPAPAGSASRGYFEVVSAAPYRRINYARTSGTGALSGSSAERAA